MNEEVKQKNWGGFMWEEVKGYNKEKEKSERNSTKNNWKSHRENYDFIGIFKIINIICIIVQHHLHV